MISLSLLALVSGLAGAPDAVRVTGIGQSRTVACDGRAAVVEGTDHDLTFTGACAGLTLTGTGNKITIDLAPGAPVSVTGTDQTVRWRAVKPPKVNVTGIDNSVSKAP
uniref:DUF3060 domain-containing protein n=1 Tax=uncultured Caulobacter sp. TaxID=158749 RepID=UPI0025DD84AF|nr:DUF3060 domain-containing protein [uncultured Caulobacter sp.]